MKLLYFASNEHGGLADYAREQACALAHRGVEIELVCAPGFPATAAPGILRTEILRETVKR
ncbi:MAG: glycosyl transferase family 1, partial [Verrucomicrobia bacterium]